MGSTPLVSVVTIFLNAESFVQEAIESVLGQTWRRWELLLVDDGSDDSSVEIARQYAARHSPRVRYIEHPGHANCGMSAARNLGVREASGELIAFLDADDVWLPNKLEEQIAILEAQPEAAMLYGRSLYWYSWSGLPEDSQRDFEQDHWIEPDVLLRPPKLFKWHLQAKAAIPTPTSILVRRRVFEAIGGFEESFVGMYEDQAFFSKLCLEAPVFVASGCWDRYRQHPDSACAVTTSRQLDYKARESYLSWLVRYVDEHHPEEPALARVVGFELWLNRHDRVRRQVRRIRRLRRQFVSRAL